MMCQLKRLIIPVSFFIAFIIIGMAIYRDYGITWDEETVINIGETNYKYITRSDPALLTFQDRYYGPLFEVPVWRLTVNLPTPDMVYFRHLSVFFLFSMGIIVFYLLAQRLFKNTWWSLLTVILLVLSPRIFADSFYNSKDIPFMVLFILGIWALSIFLNVVRSDQKWLASIGAVMFSAITSAMVVAIRIPGVLLVFLTVGLLVFNVLCNPKRLRKVGILLAIYLSFAAGFIVLLWPILWHDPLNEFINGFVKMSHYPWNSTMLYMGEYLLATASPWHYIPVWIAITTPLLQMGGFVLGVISLVIVSIQTILGLFKKSSRDFFDLITANNLTWLAVIAWWFLPLAVIITFHSVLYDGWRQMYFIYPAILLMSVSGMKTVYEKLSSQLNQPTWLKVLACLVLAAGLLEPFTFMLQYHPYENVYFNGFAGDPALLRQNFEMDYWGLSNKQGIDYILSHDSSQKIKLAVADKPAFLYIKYMLPPDQASRLVIVKPEASDYFISTFRWHREDFSYGEEYYAANIKGSKIMVVYKMK
jgi:hypothetical protein